MAPRSDGSKRNPARIFSFDSLRSSSSRNSLDKTQYDLGSPKPSVDQAPANQTWIDRELVETRNWESPSFSSSFGIERSDELRKPTPVRPDSREDLSRSKARWEHLRQHVLGVSRPTTPPIVNPPTAPPSRAQTPKPSRLARFGFRHTVDQAGELEVDDASQFATELQSICRSIRSQKIQAKVDREPTGASLQLPSMSHTSLSTLASSSVDSFAHGSTKKFEILRRPHSVQSLTHAQSSVPSIRPLYQSLFQHATPSATRPSTLPLEAQVLSTLLIPFMTSERGVHMDDERRMAAGAFDLLTRTWPPYDEVSSSTVRDAASLMEHAGYGNRALFVVL
jgi:hypothetical protein